MTPMEANSTSQFYRMNLRSVFFVQIIEHAFVLVQIAKAHDHADQVNRDPGKYDRVSGNEIGHGVRDTVHKISFWYLRQQMAGRVETQDLASLRDLFR